jgi:hypothetical protein
LRRQRNGQPPLDESYGGNFVAVVYDSEREKIVIQPDYWAMSAVYYSSSSEGIVVSNRSAAVASLISASLDGCSILSLLRATHMPFGRTLFSDVHRVMCGCYLEIDVAPIRSAVKRASPIYVAVDKKSFAEASEAIGDALCRMARRWLGSSPAMLDLTGGNDTRITAAAILHENPGPLVRNLAWCVAGSDDHPDIEIATRIAQTCKWPLFRFYKDIPSNTSIDLLQKSIVQADGTCLVDSAYGRVKQELDRGPEWIWHIGSIGGELLRGFFWRHECLSLGRSNRVNYEALLAYRLYASRQVDTAILGKHCPSLSEHDEILLAPYRRIGEIGGNTLNPYKLDAMYMHKLCYSAGSTQSWLMGLRNIQLPLLSWEVTRETLSIPWNLRSTRRLVLRIINNIAPQLAEIPNDAGAPMKALSVGTLPSYVKHGVLTGTRVLPRVINRYSGLSGKANERTLNCLPKSWIPVVIESKHIQSIFDPLLIKEVCSKIGSGAQTPDVSRTFQTMFTLELLLKAIPNGCNQVKFDVAPVIPL